LNEDIESFAVPRHHDWFTNDFSTKVVPRLVSGVSDSEHLLAKACCAFYYVVFD
jgi:hypothetical protein